jgi:DNA-binding transcriptional ArsR family regulator
VRAKDSSGSIPKPCVAGSNPAGGTSQIRTLDDIIENVSESAPAILPIFRSEQQLRILAVLFADAVDPMSIGDLAARAQVAQATASREVARLAEHGLVVTTKVGRNSLVAANWGLPWARDLRSILVQTVGVLGRLSQALSGVRGIDEALVFGSWAARYTGEIGPPPRDIDVLIIGDATLQAVRRACSKVERDLTIDVNAVVIDRERWIAKRHDPFVAQIRDRPQVVIPLESPP